MRNAVWAAILPLLLLTLARPAAAEEAEAFAADQTLVAVARCPSPARTDAALRRLLKALNPFYAGQSPFLDAIAPRIFNAGLKNVDAAAWMEAVFFAQPLEKKIHWTYVYNVTDERRYVSDLLALGNIRQEFQEKSITRYRRTTGEGQAVFHLVFVRDGAHRLAILGEDFAAVERARALYLPRAAAGLLDAKDDLSLAFHGTRFSIAYSQSLPGFFHMLEQDLVAELAGVTAKPDNPLVVFLGKGLASVQQLTRELAIVRGGVSLGDGRVRASGSVTLQYGGSLHYALSSMPDRDGGLGALLPLETQAVTAGSLWPEMSSQLLERVGEAAQAIFPEADRARVAALGREWAARFAKADLQATATGVVPGPGRVCGPVAVTLLRWGDPTALPAAWAGLTALLGDGPAAEALSERGVKWEIVTDGTPEAIDGKWLAYRTRVLCHPLDFSLPGIMAGTQRYLTALHGDTLVIVAPTAPLELDQYRIAEPHLLMVLGAALRRLAAPGATPPPSPLAPLPADGTFFRAAAHPLRFVQLAFQSEAVWPQPGEADRLPVPWGAYGEEFRQFPAKGAPLEFTLGNRRNQLCFSLTVPEATLAECAAAFLDCHAPAKGAAPGKGQRARPPLPPVATIPAAAPPAPAPATTTTPAP